MLTLLDLKKELKAKANLKKAKILQRFFKTGPGEYGEGDVFLGIVMPEIRKLVKKYSDIEIKEIIKLLPSKIHEERLTALLIMVKKFQNAEDKEEIYNLYLKNTKYLLGKSKSILYKLAKSESIWERRISIIATFNFIRNNKFTETLKIAKILLNDEHDLIHKAVGWMLREIGKRDLKTEEKFLKKYYKKMPREISREKEKTLFIQLVL